MQMNNMESQTSHSTADRLPHRKPKKGFYILPNLFTLAALFGGFYAIVMAVNGRYELSAIGIFCAMILDSCDGRVARLTHTTSEFGEQMDSLSDMVSFGAAPSLVVYVWALQGLGKLGWLAAFIYCACAALRLARFNTNIGVVDKRYFQGLPSPAAAAIIAGFVWIMTDVEVHATKVDWVAFTLTLFAGLSMVTNVPFYSFKERNFFIKKVPFISLVVVVLIIALVASKPAVVLFCVFMIYGISGYVVFFWKRTHGKKVSFIQTDANDGTDANVESDSTTLVNKEVHQSDKKEEGLS